MAKLSPVAKKAQKIQKDLLRLNDQLDKAISKIEEAERRKRLVLQRIRSKVAESNLFLSQHQAI